MPAWTSDWKYPLLVFVGGGAGAVLRFLLGGWLGGTDAARPFPWVTFGINVAGSFLLGILVVVCAQRPGWLALLGAGFCGGFTTFSAFSVETLKLLEDERYATAAGYVVGSVLAGLVGAWVGVKLGRATA